MLKIYLPGDEKISFKTFKTRVAEQLVQPQLASRGKPKGVAYDGYRDRATELTRAVGTNETLHYLVETATSGASCFLCRVAATIEAEDTGLPPVKKYNSEVRYACFGCKQAFHVNCFTAMHWKHSIGSCGCALLRRLIKVDDGLNKDGSRSRIRILPVEVPSLDELQFPHTPKVKRGRKRKNAPISVPAPDNSDGDGVGDSNDDHSSNEEEVAATDNVECITPSQSLRPSSQDQGTQDSSRSAAHSQQSNNSQQIQTPEAIRRKRRKR